MYSEKDIISNIPVASPSAAGVAQATVDVAKNKRLDDTASIFTSAASGATSLYIEGTIADSKDKAHAVNDEFLQTNMAAAKAVETQKKIGGDIEQLRKKLSSQYEDTPETDAVTTRMMQLQKEADKLTAAAEGGMSNGDYVARVQALTKKYTAQFPGYADKIRDIIGAATGLEGADRWAAQQYVKMRFAEQQKKENWKEKEFDPDKLELDMWNRWASKNTSIIPADMMNLRASNPEGYAKVRKYYEDLFGVKDAKDHQDAVLGGAKVRTDAEARTMTRDWLAKTDLEILTATTTENTGATQATIEAYVKQFNDAKNPQAFATVPAIATMLEGQITRQMSVLTAAEQRALTYYDNWAAEKGVSREVQQEQREMISRRFDGYKKLWGDKGFMNSYLTTIVNHREKSVKQQVDIITSIKGWQDSQGLGEYAAMYHTDEGKKQLQEKWPLLYKQFQDSEKALTEAFGQLDAMTNNGTGKHGVGLAVGRAGLTGKEPTKEDVLNDVNAYKTAKEALVARAHSVLSVDRSKSATPIDTESANILKAALGGSVLDGDNARHYRSSDWKRSSANFATLPDDIQSGVKDRVAENTGKTLEVITSSKKSIEDKYGVKLVLGVNSAGDIALVPPESVFKGDTKDTAALGKFLEQKKAYTTASEEFWKANATKMSNISRIRAGLTGEELTKVSNEYGMVINGTSTYKPFFSVAGKITQDGQVVSGTASEARNVDRAIERGDAPTADSGETPSSSGVPLDAKQEQALTSFIKKTRSAESGGDDKAKAETSSAYGPWQFIKSTWQSTVKKMGKDYTLADRADPAKAEEVMRFHTTENRNALVKALGEEPDESELYAAHFFGVDKAIKFLKAKPSTPIDQILDKDALDANYSVFYKRAKPLTKAEVQAVLVKKMNV